MVLADDRHGDTRAVERIGALVDAWCAAVRSLDLRPIAGKEVPPVVRALVDSAGEASRAPWLARRVEGEGAGRRFKTNEKYVPIADATLRDEIVGAVRQFGAGCAERPAHLPEWPQVIDVATRIAGTGSLGRFRWAVLVQGKSDKPGKEHILELKEALPSSLAPADAPASAASRVIDTQRRLQGAPPAYLGTTGVRGRAFTVRELQPAEAKIDTSALKGPDLDALAGAVGTVLGRMHRRVGAELPARIAGRERALGRRIAAFALRYAAEVDEDWTRLCAERAAVQATLGNADGGG
jgi:uncharacterized protein (DUF2252 family)